MTDTAGDAGAAFHLALIAETARKTAVCWLRYDGGDHPVWHSWLDGALHVVSGGPEQPLPGIEELETVAVVMRSKEHGGRLLTWTGRVHVVAPDSEEWDTVTAALVGDRLNLDDLAATPSIWAERSTVVRIEPTGEVLETPGRMPDDAHAAPPAPTRATTRGPLPQVLHRRSRRRPPLS